MIISMEEYQTRMEPNEEFACNPYKIEKMFKKGGADK